MADLIHPGHPLMLAITDLILSAHRSKLKQGSILVDPNDDSTSPKVLFMIDHSVRENLVQGSTLAKVVSRRLQFVEIDQFGNTINAGWAPHLDLQPINNDDLKLVSDVLAAPWISQNLEALALHHASEHLIMPGSLPLADPDSRNEVTYYLPPGWDPVMERDIDGPRAETMAIENHNARLGSVQACRRTARTIFLGSAPTTSGQVARGIELERIMLGTVQPGQQIGLFKDALRSLADKLHYLNSANNHYWFDSGLLEYLSTRRSFQYPD